MESREELENVQTPPVASDDNGYIVVQGQSNESSAEVTGNTVYSVLRRFDESIEEKVDPTPPSVQKDTKPSEPIKQEQQPASSDKNKETASCSVCPYYNLACNFVNKMEVNPAVRDLLLWKCPKLSGAVFGSLFVLLLSLSCFSLLTVVSSLALFVMAVVGAYRFYLALLFRIKGTNDSTFEKMSKYNISLPKDKIQELARLLDSDMNKSLNQLKSVLLWDNLGQSIKALVAFYFVNMIGCCFNTLTLLILALIGAFTLPKVYQIYKKPIDQCLEKTTSCVHNVVKQVLAKLPINLNKKKSE